jgi:hypothetical protein
MILKGLPQWVGAQLFDFLRHLCGCISESVALPTGHIIDTQSSTVQPDLVEKSLGVGHTLGGSYVPSYVMAVAEGAGHHTDAVGSLLESLQDVFSVYFARARQFDDFGPSRVGDTESPGRVGSHVSTIDASEDSNLRIETVVRHTD